LGVLMAIVGGWLGYHYAYAAVLWLLPGLAHAGGRPFAALLLSIAGAILGASSGPVYLRNR